MVRCLGRLGFLFLAVTRMTLKLVHYRRDSFNITVLRPELMREQLQAMEKFVCADGFSQQRRNSWCILTVTRVWLQQIYRFLSRIDKDTAADGEGCSTVLPRREGAIWTSAVAGGVF